MHRVINALKYSDPISNPAVGFYEEQIQRNISAKAGLDGNEPDEIPEVCEKLLIQIADRSSRVKLIKYYPCTKH